ncbi:MULTISPECIES: Qat anti-phage system associated protein QatB [unclassified Citromicrobium]|uniref:Qat anti-phage system associated protein QatB n=1 Tax=unclassified Citromicrobium TaxID=2630544 RepID=UPI0012E10512|nr:MULTISPECIES: Qat anti-phage system associated protein QatB [unclassified Citromicrobium]|tara:strand:+ start:14817 stop:15653 length:837 start_codon:yes stop_codon:yes gene_type:complete
MGTSSSYRGPKSGLIPSWLDEPATDGADDQSPDEVNGDADGSEADAEPQQMTMQPTPTLQAVRSNYTRFANSQDERALGRAMRGYVASTGGSGGAARRMGSSSRSAAGVASFANAFATGGPAEALAKFNLSDHAGRPAIEVLGALAEILCPDGGTIDEAIARDAMLEALVIFADQDLGDFESLTVDQLGDFLIEVITQSIVTKVVNDIGYGSLHGSASDTDYRQAQDVLTDYTKGAVEDSIGSQFDPAQTLTDRQIQDKIAEVYEDAFALLEVILEDM